MAESGSGPRRNVSNDARALTYAPDSISHSARSARYSGMPGVSAAMNVASASASPNRCCASSVFTSSERLAPLPRPRRAIASRAATSACFTSAKSAVSRERCR